MKSFSTILTLVLLSVLSSLLIRCNGEKEEKIVFECNFPMGVGRMWIGPEYWANRLQDWELNDGRIYCNVSDKNRNVTVLTYSLDNREGDLQVSARLGLLNRNASPSDNNTFGFRLGIKGRFGDYRDNAIYGSGLNAGISSSGILFIDSVEARDNEPIVVMQNHLYNEIILAITAISVDQSVTLALAAFDPFSGDTLSLIEKGGYSMDDLSGSMALVSDFRENEGNSNIQSCWFSNWKVTGEPVIHNPERAFGPILFAQYTLSSGVLKITAQMPPIGDEDDHKVKLHVRLDDSEDWVLAGTAGIEPMSLTANFRISDWNSDLDHEYRLVYTLARGKGNYQDYHLHGRIRKDPLEKNEITVAAFTGNNDLGFPNNDLVSAVLKHDPDLLFFSGDNIYEGVGGYGVEYRPLESAVYDYLRKWYLFGWAYRDLLLDRPSITITDDHDVFHGNIWGAGGKSTGWEGTHVEMQDRGGYKMPAEWVRMVERTQTSHLPDPADPGFVEQGIGVYFTELKWGGVSFAIIEDRKFKDAPKDFLPEADIDNGWAQNREWSPVEDGDVPGASLLGSRQLDFLDKWATDWSSPNWMKVVLSQTLFANVATLPEGAFHDRVVPRLKIFNEGEYPENDTPVADMDSNGWPQSGRNRAIGIMRKGFAFHIAGDQHLGSTIQYGVDNWRDAGYAFCVPAISNIWPRRWFPETPGLNRVANAPAYTGDFLDGFGNHMTVLAVSNPVFTGRQPSNLYDRATGYGIVRFNRKDRNITIECWPRFVDPSKPDASQYPGWPITINQLDNYKPDPIGWLPTIKVSGLVDPVVKVVWETNEEVIYTIRIKGRIFDPPVYKEGLYTVHVGEPGSTHMITISGIRTSKERGDLVQKIDF